MEVEVLMLVCAIVIVALCGLYCIVNSYFHFKMQTKKSNEILEKCKLSVSCVQIALFQLFCDSKNNENKREKSVALLFLQCCVYVCACVSLCVVWFGALRFVAKFLSLKEMPRSHYFPIQNHLEITICLHRTNKQTNNRKCHHCFPFINSLVERRIDIDRSFFSYSSSSSPRCILRCGIK